MGVYFLLDEDNNSLKVGMVTEDTNLARRVRQLSNMTTSKLTLLGFIPQEGRVVEKDIHTFLISKGCHKHHEWFDFTGRVALWITDYVSYCARENFQSNRFSLVQMERSWNEFRYKTL